MTMDTSKITETETDTGNGLVKEVTRTAQSRWAIGWKLLIVPADLCSSLLSEYQMVTICCVCVWGGGGVACNTHNGNWRG